MQIRVEVLPRVFLKHTYLTYDDIRTAWTNALSARTREFGPPDIIAAAGVDTKGRMIEMLGIKIEDDMVVIYHAMKLTQKMARELAL